MKFKCPYCNLTKETPSRRGISIHTATCQVKQNCIHSLKKSFQSKNIKLNDDNDLSGDFVFDNTTCEECTSGDNNKVNKSLLERHLIHKQKRTGYDKWKK